MSEIARDLLRRLLQNLPRKLAAVGVAFLVWLFVASDTTSTAQRSLLVPIVVEGIGAEQVVVGLPQFAEVTVSGPTARVDRLRPESFEAVLDLSGLSGDFQAPVTVAAPQGLTLERVAPNEVLGILESVTRAQLPVVASVLGAIDEDVRALVRVAPAAATVRGRAAVVSRAVAVVVPLPAVDALAAATLTVSAGYAVDGAGRPLPEAIVETTGFELEIDFDPVWTEATLPLEVVPLTGATWSGPIDPPDALAVVGVPSVLEGLVVVAADVDLPTEDVPPGRYTLPLRPRLPAGVLALSVPTVQVESTAPTNLTE